MRAATAYRRLEEHGPIRPSTFVHAVMAETGQTKSEVREDLRWLVDWGYAGLDWDGRLHALKEGER